MEERDNKTIICSVLFLDIVEYSQKSVSGQISLKESFNAFLATALADIPLTDRIILDTGDGAAISFIGDIEDALKVGLSMRKSLLTSGVTADAPLPVRMGINLGPVRLVKDINNQPNIVGDGINVAQRVMGFSDVGQLLVSRSYFDAVSRISQEYAGMFHYQGSRTDKHVREHEVYAIGYPGEFTLSTKGNAGQGLAQKMASGLTGDWGKMGGSLVAAFKRASVMQQLLIVGVPMLLAAGMLIALKRAPEVPAKQVVVRYYPDAAEGTPAVEVTSDKMSGSNKIVKVPAKEEAGKKNESRSIARTRTLEETTGAAVVMNLRVLPWGEVYLDGRLQGVSPPLIEMQVAPGKHDIEIRNADFPVFKQVIQAKVGEKLTIKHTFAN